MPSRRTSARRTLKAAIDAGLHVFCEKPVAVDAPGIRSVLATAEEAKKKNLNIVSGLCWRYDRGVRETMKRVLDGAIGEIKSIQETYLAGTLWYCPPAADWTEMVYQLRNWHYFVWLSGDFNTEQHVHSLDKASWAMHDAAAAAGMGNRRTAMRTDPNRATSSTITPSPTSMPTASTLHSYCRQIAGCHWDVTDVFVGTKGRASILEYRIEGETHWRISRPGAQTLYDVEHQDCSRRSARARRSTTATIWPRVRCWRSSAGWSITPARF